MALFFDYKLQTPLSYPNFLFFEWHSNFPLLAIGSYSPQTTGQVHLNFEEGENDDQVKIQRIQPPSTLIWHPKKKIFIVGWEGGELTTWNDNTKRLESYIGLHQDTVTSMCWSSNGTRLITGDASGLVNIWKTDLNGKIIQPALKRYDAHQKITDIICKPSSFSQREKDLHELAKAAIDGDENALELFDYRSKSSNIMNKKNNMDTKNLFMGSSESLCFVLSSESGSVFYVNEGTHFIKVLQMEKSVVKLLYNQESSILISISSDKTLSQYSLKSEMDARHMMTVILNGKTNQFDFSWIGTSLLGYVSGESMIRILDIHKFENFTLALSNKFGYANNESILSISYSAAIGIIAAGTDKGNIAMWKFSGNNTSNHLAPTNDPENSWQLMHAKQLQNSPISRVKFGSNLNLLCANMITDAYILNEQKMSSDFRDGLAAVQLGPTIIHLAFFKQHLIKEEKIDMQFKGLATAKNHIVVWNGKLVKVFEMIVNQHTPNLDDRILREEKGNFSCSAVACQIYEQNIYTLEPSKVNVRTFQGTIKQVIQFTENEGDPILTTVNGTFLTVATTQGIVKVFDLSRREAKSIGGSINMKQAIPLFDSIRDLGISCDGNKVTMTIMKTNNIPSSHLFIWNLEKDTLGFFDFDRGLNDLDVDLDVTLINDKNTYEKSKIEIGKEVGGRYPSVHHWEHFDPRLLVCEAYLLSSSSNNDQQRKLKKQAPIRPSLPSFNNQFKAITGQTGTYKQQPTEEDIIANNKSAECLVVSMFFNPDCGLLVHDSYARGEIYSKLISVRIPYHFFVTKVSNF
jgi:intraflagellar transport protein 140